MQSNSQQLLTTTFDKLKDEKNLVPSFKTTEKLLNPVDERVSREFKKSRQLLNLAPGEKIKKLVEGPFDLNLLDSLFDSQSERDAKNLITALDNFFKSIEKKDKNSLTAAENFLIGMRFCRIRKPELGVPYLKKSAEQGNSLGLVCLSNFSKNPVESLELLKIAAFVHDNPDALLGLAEKVADEKSRIDILTKAAEKDREARSLLTKKATGEEVKLYLYKRAARNNSVEALKKLVSHYMAIHNSPENQAKLKTFASGCRVAIANAEDYAFQAAELGDIESFKTVLRQRVFLRDEVRTMLSLWELTTALNGDAHLVSDEDNPIYHFVPEAIAKHPQAYFISILMELEKSDKFNRMAEVADEKPDEKNPWVVLFRTMESTEIARLNQFLVRYPMYFDQLFLWEDSAAQTILVNAMTDENRKLFLKRIEEYKKDPEKLISAKLISEFHTPDVKEQLAKPGIAKLISIFSIMSPADAKKQATKEFSKPLDQNEVERLKQPESP